MTHDELLAKVDGTGLQYGDDYVWKIDGVELKKGTNALRAVVELHQPVEFTYTESDKETIFVACDICYINKLKETHIYPCETIQAIEKELQ